MIFTAIGTLLAGTATISLFGATVSLASVIGGALAFGTSLAFSYLKRPKKRTYTAVQGETQYGGDIDVQTLYGHGKTKGQRTYYAKWGQGNKYNAEVFVLANGWNDGLFDYCFVYGERRALIQVANVGGEAAHYRVDGFSDKISIRFYDGRPGQPVDAKLVADTAALGNTWKSTSVNAGLCYVVVERLYDSALFEKGKPEFEWVMRGLREYDPRKDSTVAGGSGPQRINDPATWVFTRNPAVHRLNYQLGLQAMNSGRTLIGEGKSLGQLDLATYFVAMNVCDTLKAGKPTYECGLWVTGADDHTEVLKEFEDAMAGYGLNRRGLSGVIAGAPQIPVLEITKDDLDIGRDSEYQFRKSAFERYNHLSGQFLSIEDNWNPQSLKPVYSNADVAADGRNRQTSNDFLQVTDPDIAQYLLTIRYRQNRVGGSASLPVSLRVGLKVQEGEWIVWNGRTWMISEWLCDESFNITLKLSETSADIYDDGGIDPGPVVIPPTPPINPSILTTVQNFTVATGMIEGAEGFQTPALRFTWDPPDDPSITEVIFEYRISGQTTVYTDVCKEPEKGEFQTSKDVISGVFYNARATIRTVPDRFKTWTPWVTSANVTGNQTVYAEIDFSGVDQQLSWLYDNARTSRDRIQALIAAQLEMSTAGMEHSESIRRDLSVALGNARADYRERIEVAVSETAAVGTKLEELTVSVNQNVASLTSQIQVAVDGTQAVATRVDSLEVEFNDATASLTTQIIAVADANQALAGRVDQIEVDFGAATAGLSSDILAVANATSALATRTDTLTAALGGNTAEVRVKWEASAGPSGYDARFGVVTIVNDGSSRAASFMMDAPSNPSLPTRIIMQAAQILMYGTDPSSLKRPFVFQDGVLYLDDVRVNTLSALSGVLGNVDISNANIGTLTVGTSNIQPGAITEAATVNGESFTVTHGTGAPNIILIWKTSGTMSTTVDPPGLATATMRLLESGNVIDIAHSSSVQSGATAYVNSSINFRPPSGRTQTTFSMDSIAGPSGSLTSGTRVSQITALVFKR
ncbi:phage tail protein [Agrobacterium tumefaciens]|uniref:phage tail protein n=1 Tax=Agrobacterium tumefaciens TaxID=358 RepID=UPI001F31168B|nr:phage tail protein [Agrobacterium tumefaciens]